jgi:ribosomal protein L12E/L44/L45/RPP1/RPP2
MLVLGGNASPSAADIEDVLKAAGIASKDTEIQRLLTCLEGQVWKSAAIKLKHGLMYTW